MINNDIINKIAELNNNFNTLKDNFKKTNTLKDLDSKALSKLCTEVLKVSIKINDELKEALKNPELNSKVIKKYQKAAETCGKLQKKSNKLLNIAHQVIVPHSSKTKTFIADKIPSVQIFVATDKTLAPGLKEVIGEKLTPAFLQKKMNKAYGYLFSGYATNEKYKYKKEKLESLKANEKKIKDEINNQKLKDNEIKEQLRSKPDDLELLDQRTPILNKIKELENELNINNNEIITITASIEKHEKNVAKGEQTRNLLTMIGGERVNLKTIDNVKIDGTFVSAESFKKELKLHGGQIMTLKRTDKEGKSVQINAISFNADDYKKNDKHILKTLEKLNILTTVDKEGELEPGSGLLLVHDTPHVLLVKDEDFLKFTDYVSEEKSLFAVFESGKVTIEDEPEGSVSERVFKPINTKSEGGSVILSSGNAGVYEMHKDETLAFLIRGMNVMLFNFRGYGLSEGVPGKIGFHRDIQAAYEWVKKRTGHDDSHILFKALCLSGGAAAFMSAQHPETNIFLDQTYSSMKDLVKEQATDYIDKYIKEQIESLPEEEQKALKIKLMKWAITNSETLIKNVVGNVVPQFEVAENLAKNKGEKALFYVHDDELTTKAHVERNFEQLVKNGKLAEVSVFSAPGEHAESWVSILTSPAEMSGLDTKIEKLKEQSSEALKELEEREKELTDLVKTEMDRLEAEIDQIKKLIKKHEKMSPAERKIRAKSVYKDIDNFKKESKEKVLDLMKKAKHLRDNKPVDDIFASDKADELEKSAHELKEQTKVEIKKMQTLAEELESDAADPFAKKKLRMKKLNDEIVRLIEYGDSNAQRIKDEMEAVKKMGQQKVEMMKVHQPKAFDEYFVAREQMNRFLNKAKLADNLFK